MLAQDENSHPTLDHLAKAFAGAIKPKQIPIMEHLLGQGADIDRQVVSEVANVKSRPVFEVTVRTGRDVNVSTFDERTILLFVFDYMLSSLIYFD